MSYSGTFTKQSAEKYAITVDFATNCLGAGESISSYTIVATKISDGSAATTTVLDDSADAEALGIITTNVKAGTDGESYKLTFQATSDATPAALYEADILMIITDT